MKGLLYITFFFSLIFIACQQKNTEQKESGNEYELAHENAKKSEITETKLFGGFELGMSQKQVDSVFQVWVDSNKVIPTYDAHKIDIAPVYPSSEKAKANIRDYSFNYMSEFVYPININFVPGYIDDKLVNLFCFVVSPEGHLKKDNVHFYMAEQFEKSTRGEGFKKYIGNEGEIYFIKDNLEIQFGLLPLNNDGYILYSNMPLDEAYIKQEEQRKKDASLF